MSADSDGGRRRWVWVFGTIEGLRWVLQNQQMAFPPSAASRARRIQKGDQAVLYTSRGAYHNPTRDDTRLAGVATVTGPCEPVERLKIAGREFTWACPVRVDTQLPEREGPAVREVAPQLELVKRPDVWGQYFRHSPRELSEHDWHVLTSTLREWQQQQDHTCW